MCRSVEAFYRFLADELDCEDDEWFAGMGYEPDEAARLCSIQRRFRELYLELHPFDR